jgi:MFS family permease
VAGALRAAPFALLGPVAGTLVDRWDRRPVMLCCDSLRALALGSIPLLAAIDRLTLPQLYAVATLEGALLVFYHTAHMAALPHLVGSGRLGQAAALLWPCYALAPAPLVLGLLTAALFALNLVKNVALVARALPLIPEGLRARVVGVWDFLPAMTSSLGAALMGVCLQVLGVVATMAGASAVTFHLAVAATMNPQIRGALAPSVG